MNNTVLTSILAMGGLGVFFSVVLAIADKRLRVQEDPMVEKILSELPQTNCGACGYAGCHSLAEKMASGEAAVNACVTSGQEIADRIAELLGVESETASRVLAVVLCRGGLGETVRNAVYKGEKRCSVADLTGGEKACSYSCIGYGDCVEACQFDAITMNDDGLPVVFHDACVGCGACARACPRDIIEMHPEDKKLFVYCRNRDKGASARKVCRVSCISCGLCVKDCEIKGGIVLKDNLAMINFDICPNDESPTLRCPTKCILFDEEVKNTRSEVLAALKKRHSE